MKRTRILLVLAGAAGVLVSVLAVSAQSWSDPQPCPTAAACRPADAPPAPPTACKAAKPTVADGQVIDELTAILKETKSPETFIVTTRVLGRMGPEARRALPVVIRNAERLELLEDLYNPHTSADNQAIAQAVLEAIESMVEPQGAVRVWHRQRPAPTCAPAAPATSYGTAVPVYYPPPAPAAGRNDSAVGTPQQYPMSYAPVGTAPGYPVSGSSPPPQPTPIAPAPSASPATPPVKPASGPSSSRAGDRLQPVPCDTPGVVVQ